MGTALKPHLLLATKLDSHSAAVFQQACTLARGLGARITLLHVEPQAVFSRVRGLNAISLLHEVMSSTSVGDAPIPADRPRKRNQNDTVPRLKALASLPCAEGIPVAIRVERGAVAERILDFARSRHATLILLESNERPLRWLGWGHGIARRLMSDADCSVMHLRAAPPIGLLQREFTAARPSKAHANGDAAPAEQPVGVNMPSLSEAVA